MSLEAKAALLGLTAALVLLGATFGLSPFLQRATAAAMGSPSITSSLVLVPVFAFKVMRKESFAVPRPRAELIKGLRQRGTSFETILQVLQH